VAAAHESLAIAGAGPMAQALGRVLHDRGLNVAAVASRSRERAERAARFIGPSVEFVTYEELPRVTRRILIAVSDRGIREVAERLAGSAGNEHIVLHTCGSQGPEALAALRRVGASCGVLHPLQTIPTPEAGAQALPGVPFAVGGDAAAASWAEELVALLDGVLLHVDADRFPLYHAGAVLAGNGAFAIVNAAADLFADAGIERGRALAALAPLCRRSLENALTRGPEAITGPIARGDTVTLEAHQAALAAEPPEIVALYSAIKRCIVRLRGAREDHEPDSSPHS